MRRALPVFLTVVSLLALVAGCEDTPPPTGPAAVTTELRVGFPARGLVDTIYIDTIDRLPLRAAVLQAPGGTETPAGYLNVKDAPELTTGQIASGTTWPDAVTGSNALAALTVTNIQAGAALQSQERLLAVASTAEITLPDPVAYRRDWQHYKIRLTFGSAPGEVETREIPAPAPPPPAAQ